MTQIEATIQSQTPGKTAEEVEVVDTAENKQEISKTFTQAQVDEMIKDRLTRKDKQYADYKDLKAAAEKLKAFEADKLTAEEKAAKKLADLEKKIAEKEEALNARDLRDLKRSKVDTLIADKKIKLPEGVTLSEVVDMVTGSDEDSITESVGKLSKFFPYDKSMGTGSNPANTGAKEKTIDEQIKDAEAAALKDPRLWNQVTQLKLKKQGLLS
jgi:hypothetical protein